LNVDMFNVHASGGKQMIKEAVAAAGLVLINNRYSTNYFGGYGAYQFE